ncbi:MAG: pilus assembly protein [Actinomycetota bacterium]
MDGERGQASIEVLAGIPALLLAGLIAFQLLAAGYSLTLADGAAEAGAMALATGRPASPAVREALPGWARPRVGVEIDGGRLTVRLRPPSPLAGLARRLEVSSSAWVRRPANG